ncbi:MAG: DinB family protein [Acidimicrobiia bacterium]|nr:DinB family protein [Acidimicrobiia bacterium]
MSEYQTGKAALGKVLDDYRRIIVWKLDGLSREDALRPAVPSGTNLLGIVKHLAYVERWWFQAVLGQGDPEFPWTEDDPDADWRVTADETIADIVALYNAECTVSREVLADLDSLDREFTWGSRSGTARDILLHMIEEVARHAGHMDIIRELTDGATGWGP